MKLTFEFFRDENGRLRAACREFGTRFPVERRDGKRYKFLKVAKIPTVYKPEIGRDMQIVYRLQTAKAGDVVEVVIPDV